MPVQVNCRDRRGLLSDVIMALKSYPLEVQPASLLIHCTLAIGWLSSHARPAWCAAGVWHHRCAHARCER